MYSAYMWTINTRAGFETQTTHLSGLLFGLLLIGVERRELRLDLCKLGLESGELRLEADCIRRGVSKREGVITVRGRTVKTR